MSMILKAYSSLLTDIKNITGVHLDLPLDFSMDWVLLVGPQLDKQLLQFLEHDDGLISDDKVPLPEWLMPLWRYIRQSDENISALKYLRTLLVFGYKAERESSKEKIIEAVNRFRQANTEVGAWNRMFIDEHQFNRPLFREARSLVCGVIGRLDYTEIIPKHGPGAVFPSCRPSSKSDFCVVPVINRYYPYDTTFNGLHILGDVDRRQSYDEPCDQIVAKLIPVPKDSRGPRLISVHPKESIWVQQGQRHILEEAITHSRFTRGHIMFHDQTINGELARLASKDRSYCTIDLQEASDRIGLELVRWLFGHHADVLGCSRATHVKIDNDTTDVLNMFAPMGNCLTFPIESLVFWALVRAGIRCKYGEVCTDVYVFGDDIICPSKYITGAIYGLESAGLVVNKNKTFVSGLFRESCGIDAYKGIVVTPWRCKVWDVNSYSSANSVCDLAKRLRIGGFAETSAFLYSYVASKLRYRLSITNNLESQGICEYANYDIWDLMRYEPRLKFNRGLQRYEVPIIIMKASLEEVLQHAWWHVQDSLLGLERSRPSGPYNGGSHDTDRLGGCSIEYPSPWGDRPEVAWAPVEVPSDLPWVFLV